MNSGTGTFATRFDYPTGKDQSSVILGDVNGDGRLDLAVANGTSHTVSVLMNTGPVCAVE